MIHGLIAIIAVVALCLVALLWYGIRTHKTVQQLQTKVKTDIENLDAKFDGGAIHK